MAEHTCVGGPAACTFPGATVESSEKKVHLCGYISTHSQCSCDGCTIPPIPKERGDIRCCNMHLFQYIEIQRAYMGDPR